MLPGKNLWEFGGSGFLAYLGEQKLVEVLQGAAVQPGEAELPSLKFGLRFASQYLAF